MARVTHFEISAHDPERAGKFYTSVFGWNIHKWDGPAPYWLVDSAQNGEPGIDGGILQRQPGFPDVVNTVSVESLDEAITRVTSAGGRVVRPRMAVPGVGYMAYCQDTEGNTFGMMQEDPKAR